MGKNISRKMRIATWSLQNQVSQNCIIPPTDYTDRTLKTTTNNTRVVIITALVVCRKYHCFLPSWLSSDIISLWL